MSNSEMKSNLDKMINQRLNITMEERSQHTRVEQARRSITSIGNDISGFARFLKKRQCLEVLLFWKEVRAAARYTRCPPPAAAARRRLSPPRRRRRSAAAAARSTARSSHDRIAASTHSPRHTHPLPQVLRSPHDLIVEGLLPTRWYKDFQARGLTAERMWTQARATSHQSYPHHATTIPCIHLT